MATTTPEINLQIINRPRERPELVQKLAAFTLKEMYGDDKPTAAELEEQVENTNVSTTALALDPNGEILATAAYITMYDPRQAELVDVVSRTDLRRGGLGRQVVGAVEATAREAGIRTMKVVPLPDSVPFYEKLGYQRSASGGFVESLN